MVGLSYLVMALAVAVPMVHASGAWKTCSKWRASGTHIGTDCGDGKGGYISNDVDLDGCFANNNGQLVVSFHKLFSRLQ
jgi:hypothetical protein